MKKASAKVGTEKMVVFARDSHGNRVRAAINSETLKIATGKFSDKSSDGRGIKSIDAATGESVTFCPKDGVCVSLTCLKAVAGAEGVMEDCPYTGEDSSPAVMMAAKVTKVSPRRELPVMTEF